MVSPETKKGRKRRKVRPLDEAKLRDLALSYVARFATTAAKLEAYLSRKIRERGLAEELEGADIPALVGREVERLVELKYVDDEAYAKARSGSLLRRGYGKRRVNEALRHAGVDEAVREDNAPGQAAARRAAIVMARKRRFGPFDQANAAIDPDEERAKLDPKIREKQVAAMLRAGHSYDAAKAVIDARSEEEIASWLDEAGEDHE
jgi:regulatory protein